MSDFASEGAMDFASQDSWRSGESEAGEQGGEVRRWSKKDQILSM